MHGRFVFPVIAMVATTTLFGTLPLLTAAEAAEPEPGSIVTVAGTGKAGYSGDGGPATQATLNLPYGIALDGAGNLFIADMLNNRVRKVAPDGIITTVAGRSSYGFSGDGGPATRASLNLPFGLAMDGAGNLFIADYGNNRVRKVAPDGIITTVAGTGPSGFAGDGGPATKARLNGPHLLAADATGNLFIADAYNHRVRRVSPDGIITTVAGSGPVGRDKGGYAGDGGPATAARLNGPLGVAIDGEGNLFIAETDNSFYGNAFRVRKVSREGIITTVAGLGPRGFSGDGGLATKARLNFPGGMAVDSEGNLFITDWGNYRIRKVSKDGIITTVVGSGAKQYPGDGGLATETGLRGPIQPVVDVFGNLLFSETGIAHNDLDRMGFNERVLKVFGAAAPGLLAGMPFPKPKP